MNIQRGVLALVLILCFIPFISAIDVTACITNLSTAHGNYVLTGNINSSPTCLTVLANNVSLDLNGYNISANDGVASANFGVLINGFNGTKIYNGSIIDFSNGVRSLANFDSFFYNLTISSTKLANDNSIFGVYLQNAHRNNLTGLILRDLINTDFTGAVAGDNDCGQPYRSFGACIYLSHNTTLKNIKVENLTARTQTYGILIEESNYTYVSNLTVNLSKTYGFALDTAYFASVHNLTINMNETTTTGIFLAFANSNNITGVYSYLGFTGILLSASSSNIIKNAILENATQNSVSIASSLDNTLVNMVVRNTSASFYDLSIGASNNGTTIIDGYFANYSFTGIGGTITVNKTGIGEVKFLQPVNGSGLNFTNDLSFKLNNISVRTSSNIGFNKSANITFLGLPTNFSSPRLYLDGGACPASICYNFTSLNSGNIVFNVTSFSEYSVDHNDAISPVVVLLNPIDGTTVSTAAVGFYANFTDNSGLANSIFYLWNNTLDLINQTTTTITGTSNTTNITLTLPYEGTFYWNYLAHDNSTNHAFNQSNFTLIYDEPSVTSGGTSGSGGSFSTGNQTWNVIYPEDYRDLNASSINKVLKSKQRIRLKVDGIIHYIGVLSITNNEVKIEVTSEPQQATIKKGGTKKFELNGDSYNDLSVEVLSIDGYSANLLIKHLHEEISEVEEEIENNETPTGNYEKPFPTHYIGLGAIVVIIVLVIVLIILYKRRKRLGLNS